MEGLYDRIEPLDTQRKFKALDIDPVADHYQIWMADTLTHADPLGLLYYLEEGKFTSAMGYEDLADTLDLPVPYVIGFDISWTGEQPREQVIAAELHSQFGFSIEDPDLWYGSGDGAKCRIIILVGGTL